MKPHPTSRLIQALLCAMLPLTTFAAAPLDVCSECHGADGMGNGDPMIPVIAGIPARHIEEALYAYIDGARRCVREPRMCETTVALSETDVTAVAKYYGARERKALEQTFDAKLAREGANLHERHCAACHLPPDHEDVAYAIGFPLHGQHAEYLRYAIEAYLRDNREALLEAMRHELEEQEAGDIGALVNYYASYRPTSDE